MLTQKILAISQSGAEGILWLLLALSIISLGIIFERFLTLRQLRNRSQEIRRRVYESLQTNNLDEIEELAKDKDSLEGRALSYGLRHIKTQGEKGLPEIFNSHSLLERPRLERNLNFLATLGNNAPFIGLLGTVLEIMKAINSIGANPGDMSSVIVSIASALVATAVGLFVAIPAVVAYNYFQRQVKTSLQSLEMVRELCVAYAKSRTA